jgi:hypothetical protein
MKHRIDYAPQHTHLAQLRLRNQQLFLAPAGPGDIHRRENALTTCHGRSISNTPTYLTAFLKCRIHPKKQKVATGSAQKTCASALTLSTLNMMLP